MSAASPDPGSVADAAGCISATPRARRRALRINLSNCKYEILRILQRQLGWQDTSGEGDDGPWDVYWTDNSVAAERVLRLQPHQRLNHFHGMLEICRKRSMAAHLQRMAALAPQQYAFFPTTFVLPADLPALLVDAAAAGRRQAYILKPDAGCQGKGIRLVQGGSRSAMLQALQAMAGTSTSGGSPAAAKVVAQHYLAGPLLLGGFKFDLRVYALVASADPLRVLVHRQGLVRLCTRKYRPPKAGNLAVPFMHLTNYAINKKNEQFVANTCSGGGGGGEGTSSSSDAGGGNSSKWYLSQLQEHLTAQGHCWDKLWSSIQQLVVKSLLPVQPLLQHHCRVLMCSSAAGAKTPRTGSAPELLQHQPAGTAEQHMPRSAAAAVAAPAPRLPAGSRCFELLGFDIMLDAQLQPWLIEINHSPSFNIDSPLDRAVKEAVLGDTLVLVAPRPNAMAKARRSQHSAAEARLLAGLAKQPASAAAAPRRDQQQQQQQQQLAAQDGQQGRQATQELQVSSSAPAGSQLPAGRQAQQHAQQEPDQAAAAQGRVASLPSSPPRKAKRRPLGGFDQAYPAQEQPELQATYEQLLSLAQGLFRGAAAPAAKPAVPGTPRAKPAAAAAGAGMAASAGASAGVAAPAASGAGVRAARLLHNSSLVSSRAGSQGRATR